MKNEFDWVHPLIFDTTMFVFEWEKEDRPKIYESNVIVTAQSEIQVSSLGFVDKLKQSSYKFSRFQSKVIDIVTVMIYPTVSIDYLPIFALEFVLIANKVHVVVLDIETLGNGTNLNQHLMMEKRNSFLDVFPQNDDIPLWYQEIASPFNIFSKCDLDNLTELKQVTSSYLSDFMDVVKKNKDNFSSGSDVDEVVAYKKHHAIHSPARTIIKGDYSEWLEVFLNNYHFGTIDL